MYTPGLSQRTVHKPPASRGKSIRRTAGLVAALVALMLGALVSGAGNVRAQAVTFNLTTTSSVVAGGTLTIAVTTAGVSVTSASGPCPITSTTVGPSVTLTCTPTSGGIPQNTQIPLVFSGASGPISGTVTYNANGPFAGSAGVSAPTLIPTSGGLPCNLVPSSLTSTCQATTNTVVVPGGELQLTVTGQTSPAQTVQITSGTPSAIGPCQLSPANQTPTGTGATEAITYHCNAGQSIPSGTPITADIAGSVSGTPTLQVSQNSNTPPALAAVPAIPAPSTQPVTFGATGPTIATINPSSGSAGTSVTITGTNLGGATSISFGGTPGSIVSCNTGGTSCTVTAPSVAAGTTANVTVTTPGGTSNPLSFEFGPGGATQGIPVTYGAGWNLVGGPAGTIITGNEGPLYTYQAGDTAYEVVTSGTALRAGWGYWAYFVSSTTVTIPTASAQTITTPLPPSQWIMVGNAGNTTATVSGADIVYSYSVASGYQAITSLSPGQGVWAISVAGGTVTVSNR